VSVESSDERRNFYRHPSSAPIQIFPQQAQLEAPMSDISEGGLSFQSNVCLPEGNVLKVRIPHVQPPFEAPCVVRWQRMLDDDNHFEIGVMFLDEQAAFRVKMVEQVCHILQYQQQQRETGRELDFEAAAAEWISRYAAEFAAQGDLH